MSGAIWLVRRLGWLAIAVGALALSLWLSAAHVPPPAHLTVVHYYPRNTI